MTLKLYNQLTKKVDTFKPQQEGEVSIYTCGPTVYNYPHVGNWAGYIYWDVLVRLLKHRGLNVNRVMNITDVGHLVSDGDDGEDKLEKGARREGKTAWEIAEFYTNDFISGMSALGLTEPTHIAKATSYIPQQLELVRALKEKGYTYQISDGIYFDTSKFKTYGNFAGLDVKALKAGARVEFNPEKRNPSDFALWKFTPKGDKRDMEWETPADILDNAEPIMGFPGWHLECSAMALTILGDTLDIHTGGIDHIPVHHTNEITQSEAATGKQFSRFWLHNNHLVSDGTKISKSLENGYTLQDIQERGYDPHDFRLFILQSHYRSESNFTFDNLDSARARRNRWRSVAALRHQVYSRLEQTSTSDDELGLYAASGVLIEKINNDLNTPQALAFIDEVFTKLENSSTSNIHQGGLVEFLQTIDDVLGLNLIGDTPDIDDDIKQLIVERERAREASDWEKSDSLRLKIEKSGIALRDVGSKTIWSYKD